MPSSGSVGGVCVPNNPTVPDSESAQPAGVVLLEPFLSRSECVKLSEYVAPVVRLTGAAHAPTGANEGSVRLAATISAKWAGLMPKCTWRNRALLKHGASGGVCAGRSLTGIAGVKCCNTFHLCRRNIVCGGIALCRFAGSRGISRCISERLNRTLGQSL